MSEPRIHTVDWVSERLTRGEPRWVVHYADQDGAGGSYVFPKDSLEWRAAEYGLTDVDEILDMRLHEFHLPDMPDRDDAALRAGLVTSTGPDAEPVNLFNAASTADALVAHRLRIADAKKTRTLVQAPTKGRDPLDTIRRAHGITPAGVRAKVQLVDVHRWQLVYGELPVPLPPLIPASSTLEVPRA